MGAWLLSFLIIAIESLGSLFFFDTFMECRASRRLKKYRYLIFLCLTRVITLTDYWISMWKLVLLIPVDAWYCRLIYKSPWKQSFFFAGMNYCILFLADFVVANLEKLCLTQNVQQEENSMIKFILLVLFARMFWFSVLLLIRKMWKSKQNYKQLSNGEWKKLGLIPFFTLVALLLMFFCYSDEKTIQVVYLILSVGLIVMNFIVMQLMQSILQREELLKQNMIASRKEKNQLAAYRDMQSVYEKQRRKMHDYKNQLRTIQTMLKSKDVQSALTFAEKLTESISVDTSAINTNHPVVNAVLNQKFYSAQEKNIPMVLQLGDLHEIKLKEEEVVILLSNLLDNAIRECERIINIGNKAVIHLKLVYEDEKMILSIKNPVLEKVEIIDNTVCKNQSGEHGIGLLNVKSVVEKYDGGLVILCDEKEFLVVVML